MYILYISSWRSAGYETTKFTNEKSRQWNILVKIKILIHKYQTTRRYIYIVQAIAIDINDNHKPVLILKKKP